MDGTRRACPGAWHLIGLVAWNLLALAAGPVHASPITSSIVVGRDVEAVLGEDWVDYLAGGPTLWSAEEAPSLPSGLLLAVVNGEVVPSPFVEYLRWRRALDPARFDHWHPNVGPIIIPPPTPNPQPQLPEPPVPEPSTLIVSFGILLALSARRLRTPARPRG